MGAPPTPVPHGTDPEPGTRREDPDIELASDVGETEGLGVSRNAWADDDVENEIPLTTPFLASTMAWQSVPSHNASDAPLPMNASDRVRLVFRTVGMLAALLVGSILAVVLIVWLALPVFADEDRSALRIPRTFEQLKALNGVLQNYSHTHLVRVMIAWTTIYLLYVGMLTQFADLFRAGLHVHEHSRWCHVGHAGCAAAGLRVHCDGLDAVLPAEPLRRPGALRDSALGAAHCGLDGRRAAVRQQYAVLPHRAPVRLASDPA